MITGATFINPITGVRTTIRMPTMTHGHWAVTCSRDGWCLQWAYREGIGTRYEKPWPQHRGFDTRKEAEALKKQLRAQGVTGWNGPPDAPEIP